MEDAARMERVIRRTGTIAHDFNNLLTAITGYSDLAAGLLDPGNSALAYVEEIRKAGAKASELTQELLALSRLREESVLHGGEVAGPDPRESPDPGL